MVSATYLASPPPAKSTLSARALTWWTILRIALSERLVYRGDFALGTLMRFLPIVTQIFLWFAVFQARGSQPLGGYNYEDFVAYYLLTMVGRAFSSMPGLASGIAAQIRSGEIKKFLIQPIDLLGFLLLGRVAHKLAYYTVAILPFALVFFLCRDYFPGFPRPTALAAGIASLMLSFLLGLFPGSVHGAGRLLVAGGQLAAVRLYAVQFLPLRAHVSARHAARNRGGRSWS